MNLVAKSTIYMEQWKIEMLNYNADNRNTCKMATKNFLDKIIETFVKADTHIFYNLYTILCLSLSYTNFLHPVEQNRQLA